MGKDGSGTQEELEAVMPKDALANGSAPLEAASMGPRQRVSEMQAKLHRWAAVDKGRRFDDLFNFVHDPATLLVAFDRVAGNRGAGTAGVDASRPPTSRRGSVSLDSWTTCGPSSGRARSVRCRCGRRRSPSREGRAR